MKWGFIGFGRIAPKFLSGVEYLESEECAAIASRSNAEKLRDKYPDYRIYDNYEDLCANPNIDIVYISTTHNFHYEQVLQALQYGKHVICEKPMAVNTLQCQELIEAAVKNNCFLMEGVWMRFLPAYRKCKEMISQIGPVKMIKANFAFKAGEGAPRRLTDPLLAGGSLYDVGIYPIALITDIYPDEPKRIYSTAHLSKDAIDLSCNSIWSYSDGRMAEFFSSVALNAEHSAHIYGEEGYIKMNWFWKCQDFELHQGDESTRHEYPFEDLGYVHEIRAAVESIENGQLECPIFSHEDSLKSARLVDKILDQINYGLRR